MATTYDFDVSISSAITADRWHAPAASKARPSDRWRRSNWT